MKLTVLNTWRYCVVVLLLLTYVKYTNAQDIKPKPKTQSQSWRNNFDEVWTFKEGLAVVRKNNKWGYVDNTGSIKIPLIYDKAHGFINGVAWVVKNGKNSYINKNGVCIKNCNESIISTKTTNTYETNITSWQQDYDIVSDYSDGLAVVKKDGKYGFIDRAGRVTIPLIYQFVSEFSQGRAWVKKDDQFYYINNKGQCVKNCP